MLLHKTENACIRACHDCEDACMATVKLSVNLPSDHLLCPTTLDMQCVHICRQMMEAIEQGNRHIKEMGLKCAEIADAYGKECEKQKTEHHERCAKICKRCAEACKSYIGSHAVTAKPRVLESKKSAYHLYI